jgi:LPXTG-motif cell wall-anchored protein
MKKSKILLFLIIIFSIIMFSSKVMAETLPELIFTTEKLDVGDKINWKTASEMAVGETSQLYVVMGRVNEDCDNPTDCGWFVGEANLNGVIWESDDSNIVRVDEDGKVTAISEGSTSIYATYNDAIVAMDINVVPKRAETNPDDSTGISSGDNTATKPDETTTRPDDNPTTKPDENTSSENSDVATPVDSNNTNKETNNTTIIIIVAGVVVLLLVGGAIWYFAKNKKNG